MSVTQDTAPWVAEAVPVAAKEALFARTRDVRSELRANTRAVRNLGLIVGGVGVLSLLASAAGWVFMASTYKPPERAWTTINENSGFIMPAVSTADAPAHFNEAVRRQYLSHLVEQCESYEPDTIDLTFHRCTAMLIPAQQDIYAARVGPRNARSPAASIARKGIIRVEPEMRFQERARPAAVKRDMFSYIVRFTRTTFLAGQPTTREPCVAEITFEWRPEVDRDPVDTTDNPGGMAVLSYSAEPENK